MNIGVLKKNNKLSLMYFNGPLIFLYLIKLFQKKYLKNHKKLLSSNIMITTLFKYYISYSIKDYIYIYYNTSPHFFQINFDEFDKIFKVFYQENKKKMKFRISQSNDEVKIYKFVPQINIVFVGIFYQKKKISFFPSEILADAILNDLDDINLKKGAYYDYTLGIYKYYISLNNIYLFILHTEKNKEILNNITETLGNEIKLNASLTFEDFKKKYLHFSQNIYYKFYNDEIKQYGIFRELCDIVTILRECIIGMFKRETHLNHINKLSIELTQTSSEFYKKAKSANVYCPLYEIIKKYIKIICYTFLFLFIFIIIYLILK